MRNISSSALEKIWAWSLIGRPTHAYCSSIVYNKLILKCSVDEIEYSTVSCSLKSFLCRSTINLNENSSSTHFQWRHNAISNSIITSTKLNWFYSNDSTLCLNQQFNLKHRYWWFHHLTLMLQLVKRNFYDVSIMGKTNG